MTAEATAGEPEPATEWDGVLSRDSYQDRVVAGLDRLADAARDADWTTVFDVLREHPGWINGCRVGGRLYTPLHQVAWNGADEATAGRLVELGAWRTIRTARGERPLDIAGRRGHRHLGRILTPVIRHPVPPDTLSSLQHHFHRLIPDQIVEIAGQNLLSEHRLRFPELEPLTEQRHPAGWFPVPGMYGGFSYRLEAMTLEIASWSRMGSGIYRHRIDERGIRLVEKSY